MTTFAQYQDKQTNAHFISYTAVRVTHGAVDVNASGSSPSTKASQHKTKIYPYHYFHPFCLKPVSDYSVSLERGRSACVTLLVNLMLSSKSTIQGLAVSEFQCRQITQANYRSGKHTTVNLTLIPLQHHHWLGSIANRLAFSGSTYKHNKNCTLCYGAIVLLT